MTEITIKQLMEEIIRNRTEIKNAIEVSDSRLLLTLEELKSRLSYLERENQAMKEGIEELKKSGKKNNVIIFGLSKKSEAPSCDTICQKINTLCSTSLTRRDINDHHFFGNDNTSPLKNLLNTYIIKKELLQKKQT
ncbi:hypothetical protein JTB14_029135 [Gonioctena quinquepunctata]|nr:hypothetical protein JTB14_029135 [Gonioctena quinquepunctata]